MSKKKSGHGGGSRNASSGGNTASKPSQPTPKKGKGGIILAGATVIAVIIVVAIATSTGGGAKGSGGSSAAQPSSDEAKYLGRLLPAEYTPPSIGTPVQYTSRVEMTEVTATLTDAQVSVPSADVTNSKLVLFQYKREGADDLPLIAYVKPSGKIFVGVSFCPPCQGEWQTIDTDGTLTCNSCGTKRDLETQAGISGSCRLYPLDELPATLVDGNLVIERAVIDSWTPQPIDRPVG